MRNLSVIVQEFGRAERSGNSADGFLFVNKKKEDQRLAFYTKKLEQNHLIEEVDRVQKNNFFNHGGGYTPSTLEDV